MKYLKAWEFQAEYSGLENISVDEVTDIDDTMVTVYTHYNKVTGVAYREINGMRQYFPIELLNL